MSEERKSEESLMDDEDLFKEYFAALLTRQLIVKDARDIAEAAVAEHRKLFPKKVPQDSPCDCGSICVKCSPKKLDKSKQE